MVAKKYQMTPFQKQNPKMNVKPNAKATAIALIGHGLENYTIHQILATLRVVKVSGNLTIELFQDQSSAMVIIFLRPLILQICFSDNLIKDFEFGKTL